MSFCAVLTRRTVGGRWSRAARCLALLGLLATTVLGFTSSYAGSAFLLWTPPTQNTDGSPLTDLTSYRAYWRCGSGSGYPLQATFPAPATQYEITGLPDAGECYFAVTALNAASVESVFSNEASKLMGVLAPPGQSSITVTWSEAGMALARVTRHTQTSSTSHGTGAFTTSAFTPADNSLLVARVVALGFDDDVGFDGADLTFSGGGLTWTSRVTSPDSGTGGETAQRVWTAPVVTGASMTVAADGGAFDVYQYRVEIFEYTGHNVASPTGATASGVDTDGDGTGSITLSGAPASTSEVIAFSAWQAVIPTGDGSHSVTPGTGWTEILDIDEGANFWGAQSQFRTGSTSTAVAWNDLHVGTATPECAVFAALEIVEAAAGGGAAIKQFMHHYKQLHAAH